MWQTLLSRPQDFTIGATAEAWFTRIAEVLLNRTVLVVNGASHRLIEIEFYYNITGHADDFAHSHPLQALSGRWYFHRTGESYRGGSFKGLDLALGDGVGYGGVLLRGLEKPDGTIIDGPSLLVDYLLKTTRHTSIVDLDAAIADKLAWDHRQPLMLREADLTPRELLRTARIGLSWKRRTELANEPNRHFLVRRYRYLSQPARTAKGKLQTVLALLADGFSPEAIHTMTGSSVKVIQRYAAEFVAGRHEPNLARYYGCAWRSADICRLHGALRVP